MTNDERKWLGKGAVVRHIKTGETHVLNHRRMSGWSTTSDSRKLGKGGIHIDSYDMLEDYEVASMEGAYCVWDLQLEAFFQRDQRKAAQK